MSGKGKTTGGGYNLGSEKAQLIERRLEFIRKHGGTFLFENRRPKGYPMPRRARVEE